MFSFRRKMNFYLRMRPGKGQVFKNVKGDAASVVTPSDDDKR